MSNLVLPTLPGMTFPVEKSPMWKTKIQPEMSGQETRIGFWSFPRWRWMLPFEFLRNDPANAHDELWPLLGFFNEHYGAFDSWRFNDPDDNTVTVQAFGTGDGTTTQFQLVRTRGGFVEPVTEINTIKIFKNGVEQKNLAPPTPPVWILSSTGVVTFTTAPAAGAALTWTGTFYWRCRFLDDQITASKFVTLIWEMKKLEFLSVK